MHALVDKNHVKRRLFDVAQTIFEPGKIECYIVLKDEGVRAGPGSNFGPDSGVAQKAAWLRKQAKAPSLKLSASFHHRPDRFLKRKSGNAL